VNHHCGVCIRKNGKQGTTWLTLVILATWEVEIDRTEVPDHLWKKNVRETSSQQKKGSMVACSCHPSNREKLEIEESWYRPSWGKQHPISKITRIK
jgi:hypothetical protein